MSTPTIGQLEQAHDEAVRAANARIEQAEEYIDHYRSRMRRMQENFYELAAREGVADDLGFRHQLSRVSDQIEENVHDAARVIAGFEEDLATLTKQHNEEREQLLQEQRQANADGPSW